MLLDDPCAANATDDNAMRKTVANDRIRFMVYLFSLRFEETNVRDLVFPQVPRRVCTILTHAVTFPPGFLERSFVTKEWRLSEIELAQ